MTVLSWILFVLLIASIVLTVIVCKDNKDIKAELKTRNLMYGNLLEDYADLDDKYEYLNDRIVVLTDTKSTGKKSNSNAIKLSNEVAPYITEDGDTITLTIVKPE